MLSGAVRVTAVAVLVALLLGTRGLVAPAAAGDGELVTVDKGKNGDAGSVVLHPTSPGSPGTSTSGTSGTSGEKKPGTRTCTYNGAEIECSSRYGTWSQDLQCWVKQMSPQPPADDPLWNGHTDGAIYWCQTPAVPGSLFADGHAFWAPDRGVPGAPALVDPVTLAEEAVERMSLRAPIVAITPLDPAAPLLVGMDAWMWVADTGPTSMGPITRSATAGATTVRATAEVTKVVWDMGDGTRVTCRGPGTPWTQHQGTGPSPTCGHRYTRASTGEVGGTYTVRATAHWRVDWTGAGQSGVITFTLTGSRELAVTELQVLQTR